MSLTIRRLAPDDDRDRFSSGHPDLDRFFHRSLAHRVARVAAMRELLADAPRRRDLLIEPPCGLCSSTASSNLLCRCVWLCANIMLIRVAIV